MKRPLRLITAAGQFLLFLAFLLACNLPAHADAALLLEEPFGGFGAMNPTGHAAVYLNHVCAETPIHLRRCQPGETGIVISRYHRIDGYDWMAIPLIPYLYAVDDPAQIPATATPRLELKLRDAWRREHLEAFVPDSKDEIPHGEWVQLVGASYDRRIWGFDVATTRKQDDALIARFNHRKNIAHFNIFFRNCANFSEKVLDFYYPHSIHRNFIADLGMMTPKQAAKSLVSYSRRHPQADLRSFVIPQVPGSIERSTPVNGVVESLVKSKKYVVPLAVMNPYVAGSLIAAYLTDGRFHPNRDAAVFNPTAAFEPGETAGLRPAAELDQTAVARQQPRAAREVPAAEEQQP